MYKAKAYSASLWHFYSYFEEAALARAERGQRASALRAVASAFSVFPLRATYHVIMPRPLRRAVWQAITPGSSPSAHRETTL